MGGCVSGLALATSPLAQPAHSPEWGDADAPLNRLSLLSAVSNRDVSVRGVRGDRSHHNGAYYRSQTAKLVASTPPSVLRQKLSPFLPRRVMAQLSSAREAEEASVNSKGDSASSVGRPEIIQPSGESVADHHGWVAPQPTALPAAVLLVDVSGFTRLSELYSSQGPAGCEDFSLLIAELFEKLTVVIEYFGGDIDCFAGDAVLVVFPVSSTDRLSSLRGDDAVAASKREATAAAARQALRCAEVVEGRLSGFQKAPDDPPLTVHSALAVGTIHSVICGGRRTPRSEAFIIGAPLKELGIALAQSKTSELVVAPSVLAALGEMGQMGEVRNGGCVALTFPLSVPDLWTEEQPFPNRRQSLSRVGSRRKRMVGQKTVKDLRERLFKRDIVVEEKEEEQEEEEDSSGINRASSSGSSSLQLGSTVVMPYELKNMMRFMPEFVKHRMFASKNTQLFAEHRYVSVLFVIGTMKVYHINATEGVTSKISMHWKSEVNEW